MDFEDNQEEEGAEFTFPSITNTPPRFFESPPLWRPSLSSSSSSYVNPLLNGREEGEYRRDDEEKMDVLWEDLNEENLKSRGLVLKSGNSEGVNVKFGCLQSFNPKGGKRPGVVVLIQVLRKWLLLRNAPSRSVYVDVRFSGD